ncbi:hypothetical protein [Dipodfec virus UOA04_Rod_466]|nr:hypothetical protein [Dipodfec virus UOA04_Rod_466]
MNRFSKPHSRRLAICVTPTFDPVLPGLSMSPTEMAIATANGLPVTTALNQTDPILDPDDNNLEVPMMFRRGVSRAEAWDAAETSRKKMRKAFKDTTVSLEQSSE